MLPYTNYYQMGSNLKGQHSSLPESKIEKQKSKDAAKKHAEAEKWRRWRINGHYRKLGDLLHPNMTTKKVKATILTETVRRVKILRKRAAEAGLLQDEDGWFHGGGAAISPPWKFPGECDDTTISPHKGNTVKATICCEDRPGLFRTLTETIRNSGAKAVRTEMATVGGRTETEVVVRWPEGSGGEEEVRTLRRGLKALVDNQGSGCNELGQLLGVNGYSGLGLERTGNNRVVVGGPIGNNWEWENLFNLLS